jgi:uncharacterized repeat protein (TIGR01451 family)
MAFLRFQDNFDTAFLQRTTGAAQQNVPGSVYTSESGFFNTTLAASNPNFATLGLADSGTRLKAVFQGIPAGAQLWVGNIAPPSGYDGYAAVLTANEAGALSPVAAGGTIGGLLAAQLTITNGSATAVWEVNIPSEFSLETIDVPVWIVFPPGSAPSGTLTIQGSFAPNADSGAFPLAGEGMAQPATFPEPRFTSSAPPNLAVSETYSSNLTQGETGATFTITVTNSGSATSGAVAVEDLLPSGLLTVTSLTGSGWSCAIETLVCTRSDVLAQGQSYPPVYLTGNVLNNAPAQFLNQLTATGGGSNIAIASDTIAINLTPQLSSLLPSATFTNAGPFTLVVGGANIVSGASISWTAPGGAQTTLPGTFISSTQFQASVPASLLTAPGVAQVAIVNPDGVSSASLPFTITNNSQNVPALTSINPNSAAQNSAPFILTANGSSFQPGASVAWTTTNGTAITLPASLVSSAQLQATVPANLLTTPGTAQVAVQNPGFGLTGQQAFLITGVNTNQQPQLTSISPNTVLKNSAAFTLTANGSNFQSGASVWWTPQTGTAISLPANFINSAQLQATVPANLLTTPGTAQVAIVNPGTPLSQPQTLAIANNSQALQPLSVSPPTGSGASQSFSLQYLDTAGVPDLASVWVWFTSNYSSGSGANSCLIYYSIPGNQLFVDNNASTAWSAGAAPGAAVTVSSSQCSLNVAGASVTASGATITLTLPLTFPSGYAGSKNIYMLAVSSSGAGSGWQLMGNWTVPSPSSTPSAPVLSVSSTQNGSFFDGQNGNFFQGQIGATYTVTVSNQSGAPSTSGSVTVTDTSSAGLTETSIRGRAGHARATPARGVTRFWAAPAIPQSP